MIVSKELMPQIAEIVIENYSKILLVNFSTNKYVPICVCDEEAPYVVSDEEHLLNNYFEWFCNSELLHKDNKKEFCDFVKNAEAEKTITYKRKFENAYKYAILELKQTSSYSENNKEYVLLVRDIDDLYVYHCNKIVQRIGLIDTTTGLYNKVAFLRDCNNNRGKDVGIIYSDLNGLKYTNDTFGHSAGDKLIDDYVAMLKAEFGDCDIYRVGGDEFVVAKYDVDFQQFLIKATDFHKSLWTTMEVPIASVGYSLDKNADIEKVISFAEIQMYEDKMIFYDKFPHMKR